MYVSPRYVPVAECAKLIRAALKEHFPGTKFSVRSQIYSGGAHVGVSWTDGPTSRAVEKVCAPFGGASFDGMVDLKSYHIGTLDGEKVHFGNDWAICRRGYSVEFLTRIAEEVCLVWGQEMPRIAYSDISGAYIPWDLELARLSDWSMDTVREKILEAAQNRNA